MDTKLGTKHAATDIEMNFNKVILGTLIVVLLSLTTFNPTHANENQPQMPARKNPLVSKNYQPLPKVPSKDLMSPSYKNFEYVAMAVGTVKIDPQQKQQTINDVANASRFMCVRVLPFIWMLFGKNAQHKDGLFPEVFQFNFVKTGGLSNQLSE
jgi:hypothetical protein